ncbi:MAG: M2 family metallopeptidase, partial [bacterium]
MKNPNRRHFAKKTIRSAVGLTMFGSIHQGMSQEMTAKTIIEDHERKIRPIEIENNKAWWDANVSGKDADFAAKEKAQNALDAVLADPARFTRIKAAREAGVADTSQMRQIELLYLQALEKQLPAELLSKITARANAIEKEFNVYRAKVGGKELTDSQVRDILKNSKDSSERKAVWESSKGVGSDVEKDLKALVALRNEAARTLGFSDFHVMMLSLNEQNQADVVRLFDELDDLTRKPFLDLKAGIDAALASHCKINVSELRPWHYQDPFFQEAPSIYPTDLDAPYKNADIIKLCKEFYSGIGLPVDAVIERSDLFEKPGKSPHAFCTDIDRQGDVRVLANIVGNEYWMGTMLHELGHAVYSSR